MLISLNAIKRYVDIKIPTAALVELIGSRLVEVEAVIDLTPKYAGIKVVKVVDCQPISDTHLHLCQIITTTAPDTTPVQVVCGAPNVHTGMLAAWLMPGSIVPQTYGNEDFKLAVRKLRGYDSHGMLASAKELDLGEDSDGIIEIDPKLAQPGADFADVFDLKDTILDIENKSLTHRPDCFGLIGFAREVAGILGQSFSEPPLFATAATAHQQLSDMLVKDSNTPCLLSVQITNATLCPKYAAAVISFDKIPAPTKYFTPTAAFLAKAGMRTVSPIVDLTNVLMLETGQPLHAFDYDKFLQVGQVKPGKLPEILVRAARDGEKFQLLDGKTITCDTNDILVTANNHPVALAGAMGGQNTAIDASTQRIILESATFSLYNLRKTQMKHGIFSEAITRFTKGQPAALTAPVLAEAARQLGSQVLAIASEDAQAIQSALTQPPAKNTNVVKTTTQNINQLLGTDYHTNTIVKALSNVGFQVEVAASDLSVKVPFWRSDIHISEDITEEVGRLLGYDNIKLTLPQRPFLGANIEPLFALKIQLRNILSDQLGAHEVLTYSFVSEKLLTRVGQDPAHSYQIVNSLSPDLQYFRQTLCPSLLDKLRPNLKAGHRNFTLYEINQVSNHSDGLNSEKVPRLHHHLALLSFGDYYHMQTLVTQLFSSLKKPFTLAAFQAQAVVPPYAEPAHSATLLHQKTPVGHFGELRSTVLQKFKLDTPIVFCEIDLEQLLVLPSQTLQPPQSSKFPAVERDLTFRVSTQTDFATVTNSIRKALDQPGLSFQLTPVSIYQSSPSSPTKNLSFHLKFASQSSTLESTQISAIIKAIVKSTQTIGAELV